MNANTDPAVGIIAPSAVPTRSILQAMSHALDELPDDVPPGVWSASIVGGSEPGAAAAIVVRVIDSIDAGASWSRRYDHNGRPVDQWSAGVRGSITF